MVSKIVSIACLMLFTLSCKRNNSSKLNNTVWFGGESWKTNVGEKWKETNSYIYKFSTDSLSIIPLCLDRNKKYYVNGNFKLVNGLDDIFLLENDYYSISFKIISQNQDSLILKSDFDRSILRMSTPSFKKVKKTEEQIRRFLISNEFFEISNNSFFDAVKVKFYDSLMISDHDTYKYGEFEGSWRVNVFDGYIFLILDIPFSTYFIIEGFEVDKGFYGQFLSPESCRFEKAKFLILPR